MSAMCAVVRFNAGFEIHAESALSNGATDAELKRFFLDVVERKPEKHDFRENYQPGRMMVAIGG